MSPTVPEGAPIRKPHIDRMNMATTVVSFEKARANATSQRHFAKEQGIPRSTLQGWIAKKESIAAHPEVIAFCDSPVGVKFIHEIYTSAIFEFNQCGSAGIRRVCSFIENSPLEPFIASSYGAIQKDAATMEKNIDLFGIEQREAMAKGMKPKNITICQDESFFPETCLVSIEPASDYIILEEFAEKRDAQTWNEAMGRSLAGLPVTVLQSTSDEAKGIKCHADSLGAHHSPDIFHVQYEISKGTSPTLSSGVRAAERAFDEAKEAVQKVKQASQTYQNNIDERGPGRPPCFDSKIDAADQIVIQAEEVLKEALKLKEEVGAEIRGIGQDYHPFNLATGAKVTPEELEKNLEARFDTLYELADEIELSENSRKKIDKAKRVSPALIATIAFFWATVVNMVEKCDFSAEVNRYLYEILIPLAYLKIAYSKAKRDQRDAIKVVIDKLTKMTHIPDNPLSTLPDGIQSQILNLAIQCAEIFQRSSSCVEGRNGVLSLYYHAGRSLTPARLIALNVIHNFAIKREDGTTAAQRFSGMDFPNLYQWLLDRQPLPARPRRPIVKKTA